MKGLAKLVVFARPFRFGEKENHERHDLPLCRGYSAHAQPLRARTASRA
jgi:hypothetical protein